MGRHCTKKSARKKAKRTGDEITDLELHNPDGDGELHSKQDPLELKRTEEEEEEGKGREMKRYKRRGMYFTFVSFRSDAVSVIYHSRSSSTSNHIAWKGSFLYRKLSRSYYLPHPVLIDESPWFYMNIPPTSLCPRRRIPIPIER